MRKLLTLIAAMIMCNAYGSEEIRWVWDSDDIFWSKSSCETSGNIDRPTDPKKTGYKFIGWKELTVPENWKQMLFVPFSSYSPDSTGTGVTAWSVSGPYGSISGTSRCSSTSATSYNGTACWYKGQCTTNSNPSTSGSSSSNVYCWCKAYTAYFNNGNNGSGVDWVFTLKYVNDTYCTSSCANFCAQYAYKESTVGFRVKLFGFDMM